MISLAGIRTVCLTVAFMLLLVTDALPLSITCWITLGVMPLIGVSPGFGAALTGFSNPVCFFILASFGISAAFTTLPLSKRIMGGLLRKYGKSMKSFLLALMICILPITAFVSSVPTVTLFMAIALSFLELFDDEDAKKRTGKAFMIAIPVTCLFGGIATPVGSSMNLLAISFLEQHTSKSISFVKWMSFGIPFVLLVLPVAWQLIYRIYKPAEIDPEMIQTFIEKLAVPKKMDAKEKKLLAITGIMVILWVSSSWVDQINVMVVAVLGTTAMFLPGIEILEWKTFIKSVNFDSFFLVGTVLSLGAAITNNGISDCIVMLFPANNMPLPLLVGFTVFLVFMILVIIPVGPSVVTILALPLITLAGTMGHDPTIVIIALAMACGNCYLLPFDTIPLITYSAGYYSVPDMLKSTLPLQICVLAVITFILWIANAVPFFF